MSIYDGTYDGTNIGRFANMNGVIDVLQGVVRPSGARLSTKFLEREWKPIDIQAYWIAGIV